MISPMPTIIPLSIGMPARRKPMPRAIQNIGRCSKTPAVTATQPASRARRLERSVSDGLMVKDNSCFPYGVFGPTPIKLR